MVWEGLTMTTIQRQSIPEPNTGSRSMSKHYSTVGKEESGAWSILGGGPKSGNFRWVKDSCSEKLSEGSKQE